MHMIAHDFLILPVLGFTRVGLYPCWALTSPYVMPIFFRKFFSNRLIINSKVGKYHIDYGDDDIIPFCGTFEERNVFQFFEGSVNLATNEDDFSLEDMLSPLCVIADDAKWNSFG